jgi:hypothetical protein
MLSPVHKVLFCTELLGINAAQAECGNNYVDLYLKDSTSPFILQGYAVTIFFILLVRLGHALDHM